MSVLYWLFIEKVLGGYFSIGRCADLAQMDLLIWVVLYYNHKRWQRLKKRDREEVK